ncbi:MAG TPA: DinB family protein [Chloroflexota bacterium]|nr:DinB family protein [Chloroflexota bacterium]
MADTQSTLDTFYRGWHHYQTLLTTALAPLSPDQLAWRPTPRLRSLGDAVRHMIGARARWFHGLIGEGDAEFAALGIWDRPGMPARDASELVAALQLSWRVMEEAIGRWTPAEWAQSYENDPGDEPATFTRQWVVWHLIEHDLHHGGEVSLMLGVQGLSAPDL